MVSQYRVVRILADAGAQAEHRVENLLAAVRGSAAGETPASGGRQFPVPPRSPSGRG